MSVQAQQSEAIFYPFSDGEPMGDNTLQIKWILSLYSGFEGLFRHNEHVFVAANLFWYPVEGDPTTVKAPDGMIAFGRPKGDRLSYKQWEENDIPPQVVFEIQSKSNTPADLAKTHAFYEEFEVEEYYNYDPLTNFLQIWLRDENRLRPVQTVNGFVSPRLKVKFEASRTQPMRLIGPDGQPFQTYLELLEQSEHDRDRAIEEARKAQQARRKADDERRKADEERRKADEALAARDRLAAKLRELGVDPDAL